MADVMNEYFSSVFTTEHISSLPVPVTKFEGDKSGNLEVLLVTPELITNKIKNMKDNTSPGVDGIPPKLPKEIVKQISTPLAKVFHLSLEEDIVLSEWKEANIVSQISFSTLTHILLWLREITGRVEERVKHGVATLTVHSKYMIIGNFDGTQQVHDNWQL